VEDRPEVQGVLVAPGRWVGPVDEREPIAIDEPLARRYAVREVRVRLHQARFRALVLPAYRERCTVCRLRETRLLDAAHIARDVDPRGAPVITNGLSLCSIHHRAYDEDLVGISPDYRVHVAARLLDDEDGPMLDLLKGFEGTAIELPRRPAWQPDRELLADRFEHFRAA
jgi:putative restriction endonuclease